MSTANNCANCRFHSKQVMPMPAPDAADGADDGRLIVEDVPVYFCRVPKGPYAGARVGVEPIDCAAWEQARKATTDEVDALMARFNNRTR